MANVFKRIGRSAVERIAQAVGDRVIANRLSLTDADMQQLAQRTVERLRSYYENFSGSDEFTKSGVAYMWTHFFDPWLRKKTDRLAGADKGTQLLLALRYQELRDRARPLPSLDDVEFRCFSQNGEDGILLYIFSLIGTTNKAAVELCAGPGFESMSANLIINHGWRALLMDGNAQNISDAGEFFYRCQDTFLSPPVLLHSWITTDNVNTLIRSSGFEGEIDMLALDMDGVDYWIWKAIDCIQPRVVVLEYNASWGAERAITVPYTPNFAVDWTAVSQDPRQQYYFGASLMAFVKLAREKGYRLVGCQRAGHNAFFVRCGIGESALPTIDPSQCFNLPLVRNRGHVTNMWRDWPAEGANYQWIEV